MWVKFSELIGHMSYFLAWQRHSLG